MTSGLVLWLSDVRAAPLLLFSALPSLLSASSWGGWSPLEPHPQSPWLPLLTQGRGACFQDVLPEDQDVFFSGAPGTPFCLLGLKCIAGPSPSW